MKSIVKLNTYLIAALFVGLVLPMSCIKEELPNIEVDITNISSSDPGFVKAVINENSVSVFVDTTKSRLNNLNLEIEISEGAKISPDPSTVHNYTSPQYFEINSEDGEWTKVWEVNTRVVSEDFPTYYNFNNWYNPANSAYLIPTEIVKSGDKEENLFVWATTNSSMSIVLAWMYGPALNYSHFGVCPTEKSVDGLALKLETLDIHMITAQMPYVSGTTYIGEFDGVSADPNMGTHFGTPFNKKPLRLKGMYNYQPQMIASTQKMDAATIKAVLFRVTEESNYLNGYEILDMKGPRILGYAEFNPDKATNGYESFDLEFTYNQEPDPEEMADWEYAMTVYFTSSKEGYQFVGAGGTTLLIDNVELICDENK